MRTLVSAHQRRVVRRAVAVECHVVRTRDYRLIARRGLDASPLGLLVVAEAPTLTGEPVLVAFRLAHQARWYCTEATVVRVVHGRRPGDGAGRCLGLELDPLPASMERHLRTALHRVPPPLPMREPRVDYAASVHLAALS